MERAKTNRLFLFFSFLILLSGGAEAQKTKPVVSVPTPQVKELSAKEIARKALPAVVLLICDDSATEGVVQGSGFFIKPGILVTNYHVIKGNTRGVVQVAFGSKREKKNFRIARIIAYDEESDLALLSIPAAKEAKVPYLFLALENESVDVGETIYALGNPEGLVGTISPGIISANQRSSQKKARLQITAPISNGSSGGPVVNGKGQVVGVAVGSFSEGQNLNFAVPTSLIYSLVNGVKFPDDFLDFMDTRSDKDAKTPTNWIWNTPEITEASKIGPPVSIIGPLRLGETREIASLRRLSGVYVVVENLPDDVKRLFEVTELQTDIELTLRRNRIKVLTSEQAMKDDNSAMLYLNLNVVRGSSSGLYAYSYNLELSQMVRLDRDPTFLTTAATWDKGGTGIVGPSVAARVMREAIESLVNEFCNDFLKANSP